MTPVFQSRFSDHPAGGWTPSALATSEGPGALYIAGGPGPRGCDHAVVMTEGDVLAHDPHPDDGGLLEVRDRSYLVQTVAGNGIGVVPMGAADLQTAERWLEALRSKAGEMQAAEIQDRVDAILGALKHRPPGPPGAISGSTDAAWSQGHVEGPGGEKLSDRYGIRWIQGLYFDENGIARVRAGAA